jgi:hypothetical protein
LEESTTKDLDEVTTVIDNKTSGMKEDDEITNLKIFEQVFPSENTIIYMQNKIEVQQDMEITSEGNSY